MEKLAILQVLAPMVAVGVVATSIGWVATTYIERLRDRAEKVQ